MVDTKVQQMEKAGHFIERLIILVREDRAPRLGKLPALYSIADSKVRGFIQEAGRGRPGDARVPDDLLDPAAAAVQAILVRELTTTRQYAATVYQPFEPFIPYESL